MNDTPTQDKRMGRLATPLGKDKLLLSGLDATEGLGELFEFRVEALSDDGFIDFDTALGLNSSVHLDTSDGAGRDFSGVLTEARRIGRRGNFYVYNLILRPWPYLLSLTSDCRIFEKMTPVDIIKKVFSDRGFKDVIDLISNDYPTLEYTVQYRETDLNFVLRLMEQYGIYYYFSFEAELGGGAPSIHYLVLGDLITHEPLQNPKTVKYMPSTAGDRRDVQQFNSWIRGQAVVSGTFTLNEYDYEQPKASQKVTAEYAYKFKHGDMEIYNFPGGYTKRDVGTKLAQVDRDVERTRNLRWSASGYAPSLTPGYTITRKSLDTEDKDDNDYLLLRCTHSFGTQYYQAGNQGGSGTVDYAGTYEMSLSDIPFRMPARTRKPVIVGTQSALVVGQQGEEIDVDKDGRICVQFYWDRKQTASRRVRVAQIWAGNVRGAKFLPRIGDEVMIQYEEGDPDRPLVVGSVYNGTNPIPSDLPAKKNVSGLLTRSTKNSRGYHMLTFDDTAGQEVIKLRSQRDLMVKALRNEQRDIKGSQTENIGGDLTQNVAGDQTISVGVMDPPGGGNYSLTTTQTISLTATQTLTLTVGASSITMTAADITIQAPMVYINP